MISFQLVLIVGRIITVSGKTVKFPDQHNVKQPFLAVLDHLLEIRAVVGFGRKGAVNVVLDHGDAVLFGISRTFTNLAFDGFLTLVIAGICLLYTSDAADEEDSVDLGGRRIIKKKTKQTKKKKSILK